MLFVNYLLFVKYRMRFHFVRPWETTFLLLITLWNIGTVDGEKVVEVNEEDLKDHGININLSDLDVLLPVVHPLPPSSPFQISTQNHVVRGRHPRPSSGQQSNNNTLLNTILKFAQPPSTQAKASPKIPMVAKPRHKHGVDGDHEALKIQSKDELNGKQVMPTRISGRKLTRGKLKQKEVYYNIYDRDEPVVLKTRRKPLKLLPKDKQEILNNTLSFYGLRLDPKGKTVILKEEKTSPKRRNRQKKKKNTHHHKTLEHVQDEEQSSKIKEEYRNHHNKKADEHDMMKSLWDIFKTVSRKWK